MAPYVVDPQVTSNPTTWGDSNYTDTRCAIASRA
jgi:hypothetical protein